MSNERFLGFLVNYNNTLEHRYPLGSLIPIILAIQEFQVLGMILLQFALPTVKYNILDAILIIARFVRPYVFQGEFDDFSCLVPLIALLSVAITQLLAFQNYDSKLYKNLDDYVSKQSNLTSIFHTLSILQMAVFSEIFFVPYLQMAAISVIDCASFETVGKIVSFLLSLIAIIMTIGYQIFNIVFSKESIPIKLINLKYIYTNATDYLHCLLITVIVFINCSSSTQTSAYIQSFIYLVSLLLKLRLNLFTPRLLIQNNKYDIAIQAISFSILLSFLVITMIGTYNSLIAIVAIASPLLVVISLKIFSWTINEYLYDPRSFKDVKKVQYQLVNFYSNRSANFDVISNIFYEIHHTSCSLLKCPCQEDIFEQKELVELYNIKLIQIYAQLINEINDHMVRQQYCLHYIQALIKVNQQVRAFQQINLILLKANVFNVGREAPSIQSEPTSFSMTLDEGQRKRIMEQHHHFDKISIQNITFIRKQKLMIILETTKSTLISGFDIFNDNSKAQLSESVQLFLRIEEQNSQLKTSIQTILNKKKDLFGLLSSQQKIKAINLLNITLDLTIKIQALEFQLNALFQEFPSRKMQSINAFYQAEVVNNYLQAYKIINYNAMTDQALIKIQKNQIVDLLANKANYMVVCMDHQGMNLSIKKRSQDMCKIFGYEYQQFQEFTTVNSLLPAGFTGIHRNLVEDFLVSGSSKFFRDKGLNLCSTKSQFLKVIDFFFDFDLNQLQEITFSVFMQELQQFSSFILLNEKHRILGVSRELCAQLGVSKEIERDIPILVQLLDIHMLIPQYSQLKEVSQQGIQFNFIEDITLSHSSTQQMQVLRNRMEFNAKYISDIVIHPRKYHTLIEIKNISKQQKTQSVNNTDMEMDSSSQEFPLTLELEISQEYIMPTPNEYNLDIFSKMLAAQQQDSQPQDRFRPSPNQEMVESYQDQLFSPGRSHRQLIDKSGSHLVQQKFFRQQEHDESQKSSSLIKGKKAAVQPQNQDLRDNIKEQLMNEDDDHTSAIKEETDNQDKNRGTSSLGTFTQNFKCYKKYELLQQLQGSQTFSIYFDIMLASFVVMASIGILFCILLMSNSTSDVSKALLYVNILDFQASLMSPIYIYISALAAKLNYQQLNISTTQIVNYYSNLTYYQLKANNEQFLKNQYLNEFIVGNQIEINQLQDDVLSNRNVSFREGLYLLLQANYDLVIDEAQPTASTYVFYTTNLNGFDVETQWVNDEIVTFISNQSVNLNLKWIILCVRCIYLVMLFQLSAWLLFIKYKKKYLKILKLFIRVDFVWVYRDLERVKEILNLLAKDADSIFRYRFNLISKERFYTAELNRRQILVDKIEKTGIFRKRDKYKLLFDRLGSFLLYCTIFGLFFTYAFILTVQGLNYITEYSNVSYYFNQISQVGVSLPQMYALREISYYYHEQSPYFADYPQVDIDENLIIINDSIGNLTSFLSTMTDISGVNGLTDLITTMNGQDLCTYMSSDIIKYQPQCDSIYQGSMKLGLQAILTMIRNTFANDFNNTNSFQTRNSYANNEIEAGLILSTVFTYVKDQIRGTLSSDASSLNSKIQTISILYIVFSVIMIVITLLFVRKHYYQQFQDVKKTILLLPQAALFVDDLFERYLRQTVSKEQLI